MFKSQRIKYDYEANEIGLNEFTQVSNFLQVIGT